MSCLNSVTLIGNLGKNPEVLKKTDKGAFVKLQLAISKKYRDANKKVVEDTQWHSVCLNNGSAKFAVDYLNKGDKILVIGELRTNKWKDKEGIEHYSTSIFGKECKFISGKLKAKADTANTEVEAFDEATV